MAIYFDKVTIIGVGLIGGSLARAMKAGGIAGAITGSGRSRETLERALALGIIDIIEQDHARSVEGADMVVLASPVGTFEQVVREIGPVMKKGSILTDVGSVKGKLVRKIDELVPAGIGFVPAHPIAGKEKSGVTEATGSLFNGARCFLTPTEKTDQAAMEKIRELWQSVGANVLTMDPDMHDQVFAAVSHLPHVAAYAMVNTVSEMNAGTENFTNFSGAGFRDFTRIAASSPEIWKDICLMNRKNIVEMIERYQFSLNRIKKAIHSGDAAKIEKHFKAASDVRRGLG